jgi:DNA mismatch repair protein MutL
MPAEMVDVNVHPTKLEVRFQDSGRLYSQLLATLRTKFLSTDLTARLQPAADTEAADAVDPVRADQMRRELVDWAKGRLATFDGGGGAAESQATLFRQSSLNTPDAPRAPLELATLDRHWQAVGASREDDHEPHDAEPRDAEPRHTELSRRIDSSVSATPRAPAALQLHNRYLITECDDGMVVIDQHALHERILYEHLREKVLSGALESQALLVPEPVDLAPAEAAAALEARDLLTQLGLTVEAFGGDTLLISSYPAMLANFRPSEILRDLVDQLLAGGKRPDRRDILDSLLHMISCKAAIKAGDRLSGEEIAALLEQRHLARDTHHCPHGRPTALYFSRDELDKQFKRT